MSKLILPPLTMEELWFEARNYGFVRLDTSDDGTYSCSIEFITIKSISLEAHSGFRNSNPKEAIYLAIVKAIEIASSFLDNGLKEKTERTKLLLEL